MSEAEDKDGGPVQGVDGRDGKLGEMPRKRKRDDEHEAVAPAAVDMDNALEQSEDDSQSFGGFSNVEDGDDVEEEEDDEDEDHDGGLVSDGDADLQSSDEQRSNDVGQWHRA